MVDLVEEGGATIYGPLKHLVRIERVGIMIGRWRGVRLASYKLGGGRRLISDLTIKVEG